MFEFLGTKFSTLYNLKLNSVFSALVVLFRLDKPRWNVTIIHIMDFPHCWKPIESPH